MFDYISQSRHDTLHDRSVTPIAVSIAVHSIAIIGLLAIPFLYVSSVLPVTPTVLAFVAAPAPPPPPPPPPAAPAAARPRPVAPSQETASALPAPVEAPSSIAPETGLAPAPPEVVTGGIEGGVPGGVAGGVVGGLTSAPPPPAPPSQEPIRVGGQISAPAILSKVEPTYPAMAVLARVEGVVVLEAVVDTDGRVTAVKVLRSIPLLDAAATEAVRQWRYSPLVLNGSPQSFVLSLTVRFSIPAAARQS